MNKIFRNIYTTTFYITCLALLGASCAKDGDSSGDDVTIITRAVSMENYTDNVIKSTTKKKASHPLPPTSSLISTVYFDQFVADIQLNNAIETVADIPFGRASEDGNSQKRASLNVSNTTITPKTYYRFMLFDKRQSWDSWSATWTVSGTSNNWVTSAANQTYDWYAGSYNKEQSLPSLTYDQVTMPLDDVTSEFMAARGTVTTSSKNNYVNFTFQRKTAALTFIFDARKMKSKITEISLSPVDKTILKGGIFNLANNQVESLKNPTVSTLDNTKWKNYDVSTGDSVKIASFYTLGTTNITNFEINLDKLVLQNLSSQVPYTQTFYNRTMTLPVTIKPVPGQRNTFTIVLREL
jgi:hypothetical protein